MGADLMRAMARNNANANLRLLKAQRALDAAAWTAPRTSFFPSIALTANHILEVDLYYIDALTGGGRGLAVFETYRPYDDAAALSVAQRASDDRLVAFCDGLDDGALARPVSLDSEGSPHIETVADVLLHLFQHQIHHRGQIHAMLSGTAVAPPQLDEFHLAYNAVNRTEEAAVLGY